MNLRIENLSYNYGKHKALSSISCNFHSGQLVAVMGENGSGKSTLLRCIDRIFSPTKGEILFNEQEAVELTQRELAELVAYVPQYADEDLFSTVFDSVMLGRVPYIDGSPSKRDYACVANSIVKLGLEELAMRYVGMLSGGERQRVMIARALAQSSQIILLDEPISNLDLKQQLKVMSILKDLAEQGRIVIVAIHDIRMAACFCNSVLMLKHGNVVAFGGKELFTAEYFRKLYDIDSDIFLKYKPLNMDDYGEDRTYANRVCSE